MKSKKTIIETIRKRTSVRSFDETELHPSTLEELKIKLDAISAEEKSGGRFVLINKAGQAKGSSQKLGTYGIISGATSYIVGIIDKHSNDPLAFGYSFERIVLAAAEMNLGTCWLGGTFNRADFVQKIELQENEWIPIVSPVGMAKEKPRTFEKVFRGAIGADKRKAWSELFFTDEGKAALTEEEAGEYKTPLEMVRLGPSASNKQPWRMVKEQDKYHFFLSRSKGYGVPGFDIQKNDIGIGMCHFELTAREMNLNGRWEPSENTAKANGWEYITTWVTENQLRDIKS